MRSVAEIFKQFTASLMVLSYTINEFSKIIHILTNFVKTAPDDYFENPKGEKKSFKEIPLYFTQKGETAIKEKLSEYPHVFQTGGLKMKWRSLEKDPGKKEAHPNLLYLIGQFLSALAIKLDYLELHDEETFKKYKDEIDKLFKIWGSREKMNANVLFNSFESINNKTALKDLEKKLSDSAAIVDKIDIKE